MGKGKGQYLSRKDQRRPTRAEERVLVQLPSGGDIRVAVCYPNRYFLAMSNLGFQAVYRLFSEQARFFADRAYIPDNLESNVRTFETGATLQSQDIVALSVSFETDYPFVLRLLQEAGVDLAASEEFRNLRLDHAAQFRPFILGGGAALTLNPEPVANFFDAILIGEGEEVISEITAVYLQARESGASFHEFLVELSAVEGVYVPSLYQPEYREDQTIAGFLVRGAKTKRVLRRYVSNLDTIPTHTIIQTPNTEFRSMFITETGRGCEVGCRFCVAGYMYRPTRKRSEAKILESVRLGVENGESIGFVGAAVSSHPAISRLARSVAALGKRASLSSIMSQKVTPELAASLSESEYKTVALAPEAGSERLRFAVGKRVCDEQLIDGVSTLAQEGIRNFKLYFIVGLPGETEEDVHSISRLVFQIRQKLFAVTKGRLTTPQILLSVNPFIPKAWTPFQRHGMLPFRELERRLAIVRTAVAKFPNVEMKAESPRESYFQAVMSRGDRRVGTLLADLVTNGRDWRSLVRAGKREIVVGVPPADFYVHRTIMPEEVLPWEIVDLRVSRILLEREYQRSLAEDVTPLITRAREAYLTKSPPLGRGFNREAR